MAGVHDFGGDPDFEDSEFKPARVKQLLAALNSTSFDIISEEPNYSDSAYFYQQTAFLQEVLDQTKDRGSIYTQEELNQGLVEIYNRVISLLECQKTSLEIEFNGPSDSYIKTLTFSALVVEFIALQKRPAPMIVSQIGSRYIDTLSDSIIALSESIEYGRPLSNEQTMKLVICLDVQLIHAIRVSETYKTLLPQTYTSEKTKLLIDVIAYRERICESYRYLASRLHEMCPVQ